MNIKLIFLLSLFGLAMAIATVFWIPSSIEPLFWLVILAVTAYLIARECTQKYFLHGLLLGLFNCVWVTSAHLIFFNTYIANHAQEVAMIASSPFANTPRLMMSVTGIGISLSISGIS